MLVEIQLSKTEELKLDIKGWVVVGSWEGSDVEETDRYNGWFAVVITLEFIIVDNAGVDR